MWRKKINYIYFKNDDHVIIYSGIPISRTLGFPNLPMFRTKPYFPWICFTQALQIYPRFLEPSISRNSRYLEPILAPVGQIDQQQQQQQQQQHFYSLLYSLNTLNKEKELN